MRYQIYFAVYVQLSNQPCRNTFIVIRVMWGYNLHLIQCTSLNPVLSTLKWMHNEKYINTAAVNIDEQCCEHMVDAMPPCSYVYVCVCIYLYPYSVCQHIKLWLFFQMSFDNEYSLCG